MGRWSPPHRPLTAGEEHEIAARINADRPDVVWVGIGVPKQEKWMARMRPLFEAPVLVGVGAAFDFLAGRKRQAPPWMQRRGLEWLFRLSQEPRRLLLRYLRYNPASSRRLRASTCASAAVRSRRRPHGFSQRCDHPEDLRGGLAAHELDDSLGVPEGIGERAAIGGDRSHDPSILLRDQYRVEDRSCAVELGQRRQGHRSPGSAARTVTLSAGVWFVCISAPLDPNGLNLFRWGTGGTVHRSNGHDHAPLIHF